MAQPTLIPNCDGARFESLPLDAPRNRCILALDEGHLSTVDASKAKWWATELEQRVITRSLQLHGGYGFMEEFPIARAFRDSRVQTIYGGTTEIMKEIIARDIAKRAKA